VRRLNDLGFAVEEIAVEPSDGGAEMRVRVAVSTRRFHARELQRRTGLVTLEGQARLLLNDLREYQAWLELNEERALSDREGAGRWLANVLQPSLARLVPAIGPARDPIQAYCDVLETKWILSEQAGRDVGLDVATASYLEQGAPAPEQVPDADQPQSGLALDVDWSAGLDHAPGGDDDRR
jgi:hypothetical protein